MSKTKDNAPMLNEAEQKHGLLSKFGSMFKHKNNGSNEFEKANKQIESKMAADQKKADYVLDILLLGAGGSGKTTMFKQMEKMYNGHIEQKELEQAAEDIRRNVLMDLNDLCKHNIKLNSNNTKQQAKFKNQELQDMCFRVSSWPSDFLFDNLSKRFTPSLAKEILALWSDPAMEFTWKDRKNSHIMDNTPYFFAKAAELAEDSFIPSFDDFVRYRDQTTGINQKAFICDTEFGRYKFKITDVGGQRSERRKWLKLFNDISVVVYVTSLVGYDQTLYEDNTKNCLEESLELFSQTCNNKVFDGVDWVIFFNKSDIFEEKIKSVPFTKYKSDFNEKEKHNPESVKHYFEDEFKRRFNQGSVNNKQRKGKKGMLYFHVTNATDQGMVSGIMQRVQVDLIKSQMKRMGYMN